MKRMRKVANPSPSALHVRILRKDVGQSENPLSSVSNDAELDSIHKNTST